MYLHVFLVNIPVCILCMFSDHPDDCQRYFVTSKVRLGYRSCICGTEECKEAMSAYFDGIHDDCDPTKYFPWLYVNIPKLPKSEALQSRSGLRNDRVATRQEKRKCRALFCRHLQLKQDVDYSGKVVAFPVHFPLIW